MSRWFAAGSACLVWMLGCGASPEDEPIDTGTASRRLAGETASGAIPEGMPARVAVGLFEDTGGTWMASSGVAWDARYRYFTKGWVNNWGWGSYDGSWGLGYLNECAQQGFIPAVQYYQLFGEPGGGESATLTKVQNATTMRSYFSDFKILMDRVAEFGGPAMVLLEADATAFLQQQSGGNPNAYAAVADTGLSELSGLPNTLAGWGLAFLQLKQAAGAENAILGLHVSAWASGKDIAHFNVTDPLGPEVDAVYGFLAPMGLTANVTGQQYDVLVGDPLDRDADFYRLTYGQDRWWDPSDAASISSKSFNRYAEWLRLWNEKASKRWVLWQIPLGNSNHLNVPNNGGSREGYKDNRPEYFFGSGTAHIEKFADAGVVSLLFGAGTGGQSWYTNDTYTDGQLFMQSRAGAILNAGGVPLATGTSGGGGTGGSGGSGGTSGSGGGGGTAGSGGTGGSPCDSMVGTGTGLTGEYFDSSALSDFAFSRTDATVDFDWGGGSPGSGVGRNGFSVRWTGQISPKYDGTTTFITESDDGIRLVIDGDLVIDNWTDHAPTENSATVDLVAGQAYDIEIEYYENRGGALARLSWSHECEGREVVPASQLYPVGGAPEPPPEPPPSDPSQYGFESSVEGWATTGGPLVSVESSSDQAYAGAASLQVNFNGGAGTGRTYISEPATPAGATVTFQIWLPPGAPITSVQPYVLQGSAGGWAWTGAWTSASSLQTGQWNTLTVQVPGGAATPLWELGVEFSTNGSFSGAAYVDAIRW